MRHAFVMGSAAALVLVMSPAFAADDFRSGPQRPSVKIRPFNPLHCSGPSVGEKNCLV